MHDTRTADHHHDTMRTTSIRLSLLLLVALLGLTAPLVAQPQIGYMFPDIGTQGMNTAVEIVARHDATGTFGNDGFYHNNGTDLGVTVRPSGSRAADLMVGPVAVSWNGRLISTQVFVRFGAAPGPAELSVTNASGTTTVLFEIVTPAGPINNPASGALGSGGGYGGFRSKRGAMIVESLTVFSSSTFTINTTDRDAATPGNQGYLPFVIIVKDIVSLGPSATIDGSGNGRNGGAGGGGGGGYVCDATFFNQNPGNGSDGGDGFTGGGAGGRNGNGNPHMNAGTGTGVNQNGLNGVIGGRSDKDCGNNPQGSGGGTGHPFGVGGVGWCGGVPVGGYGGGSTAGENGGGGGGGYRNDGSNGTGSSSSQNRGRSHGNAQLVPLAGGSGGAAANPQIVAGGCGGAGGGAGGAIAIYSMGSFNSGATLRSRGVNGTTGGAGGSGGAIIIGTKRDTVNNASRSGGAHQIEGGTVTGSGGAGSVGRFRHDGFVTAPPTNVTTGASTYIGPSMDVLPDTIETKTFTIRGTRDLNSTIQLYWRSPISSWSNIVNNLTTNGRTWTATITTTDTGLHHFAAFQEIVSPDGGQYTDEPTWITSQVAADLMYVKAVPMIETTIPNNSFGNIGFCDDRDTLVVTYFSSTGSAPLNVTARIVNQTAPGTFRLLSPASIIAPANANFNPGVDSIPVVVEMTVPLGQHSATLQLITNDPRADRDTVEISLDVTGLRRTITVQPQIIDFGDVCVSLEKKDSTKIRFRGNGISFQITDIIPDSRAPFFKDRPLDGQEPIFTNPNADSRQEYLDSATIVMSFRPTTVGDFVDSIVIEDECPGSRYVVQLRGRGVKYNLEVNPATGIDFGRVPVGTTRTGSVWVHNRGASPATLGPHILPPGDFTVVTPPDFNGLVLNAGDSIEVVVEYSPDDVGYDADSVLVNAVGPCTQRVEIDLRGEGVEVCLDTDRDTIVFIADSCAVNPAPLDSTVIVSNCGGIDIDLVGTIIPNGTVTATFEEPTPILLRITGTNRTKPMHIVWDPTTGTGADSVGIIWRDRNSGDLDTNWVHVRTQFDRAIVQLRTTTGDTVPSVFDIGGVYQCGAAEDTLVLVNAGTVEGEITASFVKGGIFDVAPPTPGPYRLAVGESKPLVVSISPANAPTPGAVYEDTLVLVNGRCNQEWRVALRATRYELTVALSDVDFGATNLGLPRTQTVRFTNTTVAPPSETLVIGAVTIDPPSASPPFAVDGALALPAIVQADSGTFDIPLSFTPSAEQVYDGRLCIRIIEPCDTTICVDLTGEGIRSNIYVPQGDLSFGDVNYCQEDTLDLTIFSVGPVPLTVDSIRIVGPDQAGFEIITISRPIPANLRPGFPLVVDSIDVAVRFIPGNVPPDGPKSATLEIYSDDSAQGLVQVPLTGTRTSPQVVGPPLVDYGTVVVGGGGSLQRITLTNTSDDAIIVSSPTVGSPFRIVSGTPFIIPPNGSIEVDVEFVPTDSQIYNDTLVGLFSTPCAGELRVPLTGEGLRGETVISIPTILTGAPGERVMIPIVLEESKAIAQVGATTFRAWVRFNRTMLLPVGVSLDGAPASAKRSAATAGRIIDDVIDGDDRVVAVEFTNSPLPAAPDTLGWIETVTLLGDALTTPVTFDSLRWVDDEVVTTTRDGSFTLNGYCDVGGDRLVRVEGTFGIKAVAPNPIVGMAEILYETVENGATRLEIFDLAGQRVASLLDVADLPTQAHIATWGTEAEPSGIYYVVLTTPTQRAVTTIVVVK